MRSSTPAMLAVLLGAAALAGCSSSGHHQAAPTDSSTTSTTSTSAPSPAGGSASSGSTATTVPATTSTTTLIGLAVNGDGSTLTAPSAPTTKPYSSNCQSLIDTGFFGSCLIVAAPSGTIAALVEIQQPTGGASGGVETPVQERDLVYRQVGSTWSLVLRRVRTESADETELFKSDIQRDGDPKAVFVVPAANAEYGDELDVVEASGQVTLTRQLQGGFATVANGGGLETFVPNAAGYAETIIRYSGGSWRIASITQVSQTEAQPNSQGPFTDPEGSQA